MNQYSSLTGRPWIPDKGSVPNHSSDSKYCGTHSPEPYVSKGNEIKIIFAADPIGEGRSGFFATYSAGVENCGGTFWTETGKFSNPGYSAGKYPPNLDCGWTVKSSPGNKVRLEWSGAEIEYSDYCVKDYLKVYLHDESGPLYAISCQETVQNLFLHLASLVEYFLDKFWGQMGSVEVTILILN